MLLDIIESLTGTEKDCQRCTVTGWGATNMKNNLGSPIFHWVRRLGGPDTATGFLGRSWILHPCRYSKPSWSRPRATCCRWPSQWQVGQDDFQRSLLTQVTPCLWGTVLADLLKSLSLGPESECCRAQVRWGSSQNRAQVPGEVLWGPHYVLWH